MDTSILPVVPAVAVTLQRASNTAGFKGLSLAERRRLPKPTGWLVDNLLPPVTSVEELGGIGAANPIAWKAHAADNLV